MNSQDLRNLQEAYMGVYDELDEAKIDDNLSGQKKKDIRNERSKFGGSSSSKSKKTKLRHDLHKKYRGLKKVPGDKSAEKEIAVLRNSQRMHGTLPKIQKIGGPKGLPEQTDLYDIILSHLLDEGYAETQEAAEAIMANMSEDWRESICEELTGERKKRALEKGGYLANRVATGKEGQPVERKNSGGDITMRTTGKGPTKRGGSGVKGRTKSDWYGSDDTQGRGNASARRQGKKVKDTSDDL